MRPGAPLSPGLYKQDARLRGEVDIRGPGFCGIFCHGFGQDPVLARIVPASRRRTAGWQPDLYPSTNLRARPLGQTTVAAPGPAW